MGQFVNQLKTRAVHTLLTETFMHIRKQMREEYVALAYENSRLRGIKPTPRFLHGGDIFPSSIHLHGGNIFPSSTQNGGWLPTLHYSLFGEQARIRGLLKEAGYPYVENYFTAVLSKSYNGLVLDALLPDVLIGKLKNEFLPHDYAALNQGTYLGVGPDEVWGESLEDTHKSIACIQEHYAETIKRLRTLLIDKLLLQE